MELQVDVTKDPHEPFGLPKDANTMLEIRNPGGAVMLATPLSGTNAHNGDAVGVADGEAVVVGATDGKAR